MTTFQFLDSEFPELGQEAEIAASAALADPRTSCFYSRRVVELCLRWVYKHDRSLRPPYEDNLAALVNAPSFREVAGDRVYNLAREVIRLGNKAVHDSSMPSRLDSVASVSALFQFCYWFARTYCREAKPASGLTFDPKSLPERGAVQHTSLAQVEELSKELDEARRLAEIARERRIGHAKLEEELAAVRQEVAVARREAERIPDDHDYSEEQTREFLIDLSLAEAGWHLTDERDREYQVSGMPTGSGVGFVDYVLWGDDGRPLAIIEAKRTHRDPLVGQQQGVLYADCLERQYGQRPIIFYTNGYSHWIWDDLSYPPRPVQGFYKKDELELLVQRRTTKRSIRDTPINGQIVERYYQHRAIRQVGQAFEVDHDRKSLLVMATGAGKTRTVIALADLLMRTNWVKRVLFLADRNALVKQAVGAFKQHLPSSTPVNLVTERNQDGRVFVCTYQSMMSLIDEYNGGSRRFGVGHFDLVVIDEAHRSVFKKYKAIFDYFDSLLVGLTATPKDEVDRNTYSLFDLETGVPTDVYNLDEAVADGYLVPPRAFSAPMKFPVAGIAYDNLSEDEQAEWDELDWVEGDDSIPDRVDAGALNSWLFNKDTVDRVLQHLMTNGQQVAGGDRLGKTIIFAKNQQHANFIAERFDINYPHYAGKFARVITHEVEHAQDLIDKFSVSDSEPHIAISVDMLDTGIDVPEVVNLVFFKPVRSRSKFWQMLGRGTRLCPDLFGPRQDKEHFTVFDHCLNLEYFNQEMIPGDGPTSASIREKVFVARVELIDQLDKNAVASTLRGDLVEALRTQIESMNPYNFIVRPQLELVEHFRQPEAWRHLGVDDQATLVQRVARLPHGLPSEPEESKRFDLLLLNLQLALLRSEPGFERLRSKLVAIVGQLQTKDNIPVVAAEIALIDEVLTDPWWIGVTVEMLETVRRRLRLLVVLLDSEAQSPLYADFTDQMLAVDEVDLHDLGGAGSFVQFKKKARAFLREHLNEGAVHKIFTNQALVATDLDELQSVFVAAGVGSLTDIETASERAGSFGAFVRSLTGVDRAGAKAAFARFLDEDTYSAEQIKFVNLVIDYLTENGSVPPARVYASPFVDVSPSGPEELFDEDDLDAVFDVIREFNEGVTPSEGVGVLVTDQ